MSTSDAPQPPTPDPQGTQGGAEGLQETAQADLPGRPVADRRRPDEQRPPVGHRRHHAAGPVPAGRLGRTRPPRPPQARRPGAVRARAAVGASKRTGWPPSIPGHNVNRRRLGNITLTSGNDTCPDTQDRFVSREFPPRIRSGNEKPHRSPNRRTLAVQSLDVRPAGCRRRPSRAWGSTSPAGGRTSPGRSLCRPSLPSGSDRRGPCTAWRRPCGSSPRRVLMSRVRS